MSRLELANIIPVKPPIVNKKMNPKAHRRVEGRTSVLDPQIEASQLKTLTPVGTAIVIVALVK
jgi:hypothetical protein